MRLTPWIVLFGNSKDFELETLQNVAKKDE